MTGTNLHAVDIVDGVEGVGARPLLLESSQIRLTSSNPYKNLINRSRCVHVKET